MFRVFLYVLTRALPVWLVLCAAANAADYRLDIRKETVNMTGKPLQKITSQSPDARTDPELGGGEDVVVHVTNHMNEPSSALTASCCPPRWMV